MNETQDVDAIEGALREETELDNDTLSRECQNEKSSQNETIAMKDMQEMLAQQMQSMQDMFLTKFKKLKQKNKELFKKAVKNQQ